MRRGRVFLFAHVEAVELVGQRVNELSQLAECVGGESGSIQVLDIGEGDGGQLRGKESIHIRTAELQRVRERKRRRRGRLKKRRR
jgi:hypothetical protein